MLTLKTWEWTPGVLAGMYWFLLVPGMFGGIPLCFVFNESRDTKAQLRGKFTSREIAADTVR